MNIYLVLNNLFLFLYGFDLLGKYRILSLVFFIFVLIHIFFKRKVVITGQLVAIFAFLILYGFFVEISVGQSLYEKLFQYGAMYIIGSSITSTTISNEKAEMQIIYNLVPISIGFALLGILTTFINGGSVASGIRAKDLWTSTQIASTQISVWMICFLAIIPWVFINRKKIKRIVLIIIYSIAVLCVISFFIMASRTGIFVCAILIFIILCIIWREKKSNAVLRILIAMVLFFVIYKFDIVGIRSWVESSNLAAKFLRYQQRNGSATSTSRTVIWQYFFTHCVEYPFGGLHISNAYGKNMHNIFFDLYDHAGIVPTVLFIFIIFNTIKKIYILIKYSNCYRSIGIGLGLWYCVYSIALFTEPVWFYGRATTISLLFFVLGITDYTYKFDSFNYQEVYYYEGVNNR